MEWTNSDEYYHGQLEEGKDKIEAIKCFVLKILELSRFKTDWNTIVLDKWVFNLGRLIGNIQNSNEPIGKDRGFRVALQFKEFYNRLEASSIEYDQKLEEINEELESLIFEVFNDENFRKQLQSYYDSNNFTIEITEQGQRIGLVLISNQ